MPPAVARSPGLFAEPRWRVWLAAAVISGAALAVYANCFSVPFLFDDPASTVDNPTIRHLWPLWEALSPPHGKGVTVENRPFLNFSVAINYAISGANVWSYHALNLAIHIAAALALFGIVRRTLARRDGAAAPSTLLAFCVALLWAVHPLQTESVTYIIQRAESMMGLFYLLTLYFFIRGVCAGDADGMAAGPPGSPARRRGLPWYGLSVVSCVLGMLTKEVMITAPLLVFLYDRTFVAGSFAETLRRRPRYFTALGLVFTVFFALFVRESLFSRRGGTSGFGIDVGWWTYALTQFQAVSHYLWLSVWPHPLVFDYGAIWATSPWQVVPYVPVVALLIGGTAFCLWRCPPVGFLGAWFLGILALSSVIPGNRQTLAEHRMYLSLAAVLVLIVLGLHAVCLRIGSGRSSLAANRILPGFVLAAAAGLGFLAHARNEDYSSLLVLYRDTVDKRPNNAFARYNLGKTLDESGRRLEAVPQYEAAIRLAPDMAQAYYNLGNTLSSLGRTSEAIAQYQAALRLQPDHVGAQMNLAMLLMQSGRLREAVMHLRAALAVEPRNPEIRNNLGNALTHLSDLPGAIAQFEEALRLQPDYAEAHLNLGIALAQGGRLDEAIVQYETAIRLKPDFAETHNDLGTALTGIRGRSADAIAQFEAAIRLKPDYLEARNNLGNVLAKIPGRLDDAIAQYEQAIRLKSDFVAAHVGLGSALCNKPGRMGDAIAQFEEALRLDPKDARAHYDLGNALARIPGRPADAAAQYQAALSLNPGLVEARINLGNTWLRMPGRLSDAIGQYEQALRLAPGYAPLHFSLAVALLKVPGREGEAAAQLEETLRLEPGNSLAMRLLEELREARP